MGEEEVALVGGVVDDDAEGGRARGKVDGGGGDEEVGGGVGDGEVVLADAEGHANRSGVAGRVVLAHGITGCEHSSQGSSVYGHMGIAYGIEIGGGVHQSMRCQLWNLRDSDSTYPSFARKLDLSIRSGGGVSTH